MEDPRITQWKRIIAHKRRKEQLRQQQKIIDVLTNEPKQETDTGFFYTPYIPLIVKVKRNDISTFYLDWEITA